jgi:prepilin-type N-terminal cleavage/methylation domain-containing protein
VTPGRRAQGADGFSLIEILIAMVVLSIGMVAVLGAMASSSVVVDVHRSLAGGETMTRDYVDSVKSQVLAAHPAKLCPTKADFPTKVADGFRAEVTAVEHLEPAADDPLVLAPVSDAQCLAHATGPGGRCAGLSAPLPSFCDTTVQRITIEVRTTNRSGAAETVQTSSVVVRRGDG